jgi:hypothetical protein
MSISITEKNKALNDYAFQRGFLAESENESWILDISNSEDTFAACFLKEKDFKTYDDFIDFLEASPAATELLISSMISVEANYTYTAFDLLTELERRALAMDKSGENQ